MTKRGLNQCRNCMWFAKWNDLEPYKNGTWDDWYQHKLPCTGMFGNPYPRNAKNKARPRCPECNHGDPKGHNNRECLAWVGYTNYYDGTTDADQCGCRYWVKEKQ